MKQIKKTLLVILLTLAATASATTGLLSGSEVSYTVMLVSCLAVPVCGISLTLLIACEFNRQLQKISLELYDTALGAAVACDLRSATTQTNANSAKKLATQIEQTAVTLDVVGHRVEQLADNSLNAHQLTAETRQAAESLAGYLTDLSKSIEANKTAEREFANILRTVDELGHQLNVLTVNTAIQSARIGKDSAGFAIVTEEMRRLALECDAISKETSARIKAAYLKSARSTEICDKADHTLKQIQNKSHQTEKLAAEVVRDLRDLASGDSQLHSTIALTTSAAQSHATRLEKAAAESEAFTAHSENLTGVVIRLQQLVSGSFFGPGATLEKLQTAATSPAKHSAAPVNGTIKHTNLNQSPANCADIPLETGVI